MRIGLRRLIFHRAALAHARDDATRLTNLFTGSASRPMLVVGLNCWVIDAVAKG
jgi:hypothetical protein